MLSNAARPLPQVDRERWRAAQEWELAFWRRQNIPPPLWKRLLRPLLVLVGLRPRRGPQTFDDRNHWWKSAFDGYGDLPESFENVCELGCGPYTNMRLILAGRRAQHVHLSDPLAREYLNFPRAWLANAYREHQVAVDFHAAEECPFRDDYFDLTVMINVLDHVRDPLGCLEQAIRITKPSGYFLLGQDLTGPEDRKPSNPGHPILLTHEQLDLVLKGRFQVVRRKILSREEGLEPEMHYGTYIFVGVKRNGLTT